MKNTFLTLFAILLTLASSQVTVTLWGTGVNVRSCAGTSCDSIGTIADPTDVTAICQDIGESVTAEGTTNEYWTNIQGDSADIPEGWISNIYIEGAAVIEGVPMCGEEGGGEEEGEFAEEGEVSGGEEEGEALITQEQLAEMMPNAENAKVEEYYPFLDEAMAEGEINTCERISAFLAQLAHESGELQYMEELASGEAYEGRCSDLGNCSPGDGKKYKGRGPIQLTGKANYEKAGEDLGLDLVNNPEMAAEPENAFRIAVWFWNGRSLNDYADQNTQDGFDQTTLKINGCIDCSATHNDMRTDYWEKNKAILGC